MDQKRNSFSVSNMNNNNGYNYDTPDPDSPYGRYGDVTISIQGAEGYSRMELERLACRYMQYGSNYSDRGSCQVILNAFIKSDYDIGCRKILTPGDRFVLNKVTSSSGSSTISTALNYELLSYNVSLNSNMVTVSFGMPFVELNDVIYNMLSNAGMSIIASSSDIQPRVNPRFITSPEFDTPQGALNARPTYRFVVDNGFGDNSVKMYSDTKVLVGEGGEWQTATTNTFVDGVWTIEKPIQYSDTVGTLHTYKITVTSFRGSSSTDPNKEIIGTVTSQPFSFTTIE